MSAAALPMIIQGGMGVAISDWRLAQTVARLGQLGVVSGTGIDTVLLRRLQDGDPGGHMRRAIAHFPLPEVAEGALRRYFLPEGRKPGQLYKLLPLFRDGVSHAREQILMLAAFVEVWLAKEGHAGMVGINLLTKVQLPNLAMLYGAMLANVDVVLMGAGIPRDIPAALDAMAEHRPAAIAFDVEGAGAGAAEQITFTPMDHWAGPPPALRRPMFFPIIASNSLATMMARKAGGRVDGFVIEGPTAGGHNAPPRGEMQLNERGEPVYGPRDEVDLAKIAQLGLPFWIAGGAGSPEGLRRALDAGANGIQVGTLFAYCDESGLAEEYKGPVLHAAARGEVEVRTDPRASPTGYPFKVVSWAGYPAVDAKRARICDLGYLRTAFRDEDGKLAYRCASEPIDTYVAKGGAIEETEGRKCLCNALMANVGLGQARGDGAEPPLLTSGDDLLHIGTFLEGRARYGAADVIDYLLAGALAREGHASAAGELGL
ncbi:MAG TPA: nitronate monooxygenase [Chloroflexaceae bacterium]|nr:nitronate monooxygenase [Chloroflexaceae bacterium]